MKHLWKSIKILFFILGFVFVVMLVLAFTSALFYMYYNLGKSPSQNSDIKKPPNGDDVWRRRNAF